MRGSWEARKLGSWGARRLGGGEAGRRGGWEARRRIYDGGSVKELAHFLNISLGSLAETKYLLHFANRLGLLTDETFSDIAVECEQLGKKLWSFYQTVKKNT
jgi:hypothetical protein